MNTLQQLNKQKGATLLEIVMVIGIIAVIAISAMAYFNQANNSQRAVEEVKNIATLAGSIRNMFNTQGNFEGLENEVILKSNAFPDRMRVPGSDQLIKHGWADDGVEVESENNIVSATNNDAFSITYKDVPEAACSDLVAHTVRYYMIVEVDGTPLKDSLSGLTPTVADVTDACDGTVEIKFITR
jgi:type II secretory pathway pseudopilin PulG